MDRSIKSFSVQSFLSLWLTSFLILVCLDIVWIRYSMSWLYRPVYKKIQKQFVFRPWSAVFVWILLSLALTVHVYPHRPQDLHGACRTGVLMGFILYGMYNFTNHSLLQAYDLRLAILDTVWGMIVMGLSAGLLYTFQTKIWPR